MPACRGREGSNGYNEGHDAQCAMADFLFDHLEMWSRSFVTEPKGHLEKKCNMLWLKIAKPLHIDVCGLLVHLERLQNSCKEKVPKTRLCANSQEKAGNPKISGHFLVEVTGFEPATFWSRNPNMRLAMLFHVRCCYKKETLSLDMIGQGQKHSVAIPLQQNAYTDQRLCKT